MAAVLAKVIRVCEKVIQLLHGVAYSVAAVFEMLGTEVQWQCAMFQRDIQIPYIFIVLI